MLHLERIARIHEEGRYRFQEVQLRLTGDCNHGTPPDLGEYGHTVTSLHIDGCHSYSTLPLGCTHLRTLGMNNAIRLVSLGGLEKCLGTLRQLTIEGSNPALHDISALSGSTVSSIVLKGCTRLQDLAALATCSAVHDMSLKTGYSIRDITPISQCSALQTLDLQECRELESVSVLGECPNLRHLNLLRCEKLRDVTGLSRAKSLRAVNMTLCPKVPRASALVVMNLDEWPKMHHLSSAWLCSRDNVCSIRGPCACFVNCDCNYVGWEWYDCAPAISKWTVNRERQHIEKLPDGPEKVISLGKLLEIEARLQDRQQDGQELYAYELEQPLEFQKLRGPPTTAELERAKRTILQYRRG